MKNFQLIKIFFLIIVLFTLFGCNHKQKKKIILRPSIVTDSDFVADAVKSIGGEFVIVHKIAQANAIKYSLHATVKEITQVVDSNSIMLNSIMVGDRNGLSILYAGIVHAQLYPNFLGMALSEHEDSYDAMGYNTNYWLDPKIWGEIIGMITSKLSAISPENELVYNRNEEKLLERFNYIDKKITKILADIPINKRMIITDHDSFTYFGKKYKLSNPFIVKNVIPKNPTENNYKIVGDFMISKGIKTVFLEYGDSPRNILLLRQYLASKGYPMKIGGTLYTDKMNGKTYKEIMIHNAETIKKALMEDNI